MLLFTVPHCMTMACTHCIVYSFKLLSYVVCTRPILIIKTVCENLLTRRELYTCWIHRKGLFSTLAFNIHKCLRRSYRVNGKRQKLNRLLLKCFDVWMAQLFLDLVGGFFDLHCYSERSITQYPAKTR